MFHLLWFIMLHQQIIGIVGGLGPAAGADLFQKIIAETIAERDQDHLSVALLSYADQIPDRASWINDHTKPNPVPPLMEVIRLLHYAGAQVAAIPCVTAHVPVLFGAIQAQIQAEGLRVRLLSMVEETVRMIQTAYPHIRSVGAISTWTTFRNRMFMKPLETAGYNVILQDDAIQDGVECAIYDTCMGIKAQSEPVHPEARGLLVDAIRHLRGKGAEAVILGCTELPIGIPEAELEGVITIDPTRAIARALIREIAPEKLRPIHVASGV